MLCKRLGVFLFVFLFSYPVFSVPPYDWHAPKSCGVLLDKTCFEDIIKNFDQYDYSLQKKDGKIDIFDISNVQYPQHITFLNDLIDKYSCYGDGDIDEKDIRLEEDSRKGRDGITCEE